MAAGVIRKEALLEKQTSISWEPLLQRPAAKYCIMLLMPLVRNELC